MKKQKTKVRHDSPYILYKKSLSQKDADMLSDFFEEFDKHCTLEKEQKKFLRTDFENALIYYNSSGISLSKALMLLDIKNLGGFYSRPPVRWYPLDDAAKIYPLSIKHGQMAIFRLSAYLKQDVSPELLQMALIFSIKRFPCFATTVKKGFFWHYLDTAKRRFETECDTEIPCRPLKIAQSGSQSFRVVYYKNRISVEFFHILTDGTGGICFLKTLVAEYLRLCGAEFSHTDGVLNINSSPMPQETANEFVRAEKTDKKSGFIDKPALQMSGKLSKVKPCRILHFKMNADKIKSEAKKHNASVTAYVLSHIFSAVNYSTDASEGDISIQVPVNMRKFYPSETLRNFAMYCGIRLPIDSIIDSENIISEIDYLLKEKASREAMNEMMNSTRGMVNALRYIPLFIKAPVAKVVYGFLGDKIFTTTLSNLGQVKMPSELGKYIESMDFVLGTAISNRAGCALITFENVTTLSISKMTEDPSFEEKLYELFTADGIEVSVEGSGIYEG